MKYVEDTVDFKSVEALPSNYLLYVSTFFGLKIRKWVVLRRLPCIPHNKRGRKILIII